MVAVEDLSRLAEKYRALVALRARREEREAEGAARFSDAESALRRGAFRLVARHFPGALRELDQTTGKVLARKLAAVEAGAPQLWMRVTIDFHDTLREALAVKMWLAQRLGRDGEIDAQVLDAFHAWHAAYEALPHGIMCAGALSVDFLRRHRKPPGGRVVSIVWSALAARHGVAREELEPMVWAEQG
jgi:hypothetical protein